MAISRANKSTMPSRLLAARYVQGNIAPEIEIAADPPAVAIGLFVRIRHGGALSARKMGKVECSITISPVRYG